MKSIALGTALMLLAIGLVGCGQKGPLYLPGENPNPPKPLLKNSHAAQLPGNAMTTPSGSNPPANDPTP